jgi:glycosyltransferase involved in cell wall biosynthesis
MKPLVSVIIPVFNGRKYLSQAIESVLAQSYRPLELIIVDDGSTDGSAAIAQSYKETRYIYQSNMGVAVARNTGLAAVKGDFIAFLDADDIWHPLKLQIQIDYLQKNHSIMLTLSKINNFVEPGCNIHPDKLQSILKNEQINLASLVAHKAVFDQIGGFNPHYHVSEDFDWITRAKDAGIPMVILPEVLLQRRIHNFNISFTQLQACIANRFHILKESIDRQRIKK